MAKPIIIDDISKRLPLSGGTLTGNDLFIFNGYGKIRSAGYSSQLASFTNPKDDLNKRTFYISSDKSTDLKYALVLDDTKNGETSSYTVLHEGNVNSFLDTRYGKLKTPNDFVFAGNEVTLVPGGFNDNLWFNHRTVGGYDGDIKSYNFGNGNGSLTDIYAKDFYGNLKGNADTCGGTALEWKGSIEYSDTLWLGAWTNDGKKIKALDKKSFATASHTHSNYIQKRVNGVYTNLGDYYADGQTKPYIRIALPSDGSFWNMMILEITIRQLYSSGHFGKLYIYGHCYATQDWTCFNAVYNGTLSSSIKVYGSDKKYIYVAGVSAWGGLSVDRMLLGDAAYSTDLSNVVIDGVDNLPSTYQTASMYKSWRQGDTLVSTAGTDYTTARARNISANTSGSPSGNGEIFIRY